MKRVAPRLELRRLHSFLAEAENRYLAPHLTAPPTLGPPSRAECLDGAAFVVLAHGALENFFEGIALWALHSIESHWLNKRRTSRCMAAALLHHPAPASDSTNARTVFDTLRHAVDAAKKTTSRKIEENHGIGPQHLRAIFLPLGIDVPDDPKLIGSLELLISLRHQWAHQYRYGAHVVKAAADIKTYTEDCLKLATQLAVNARTANP